MSLAGVEEGTKAVRARKPPLERIASAFQRLPPRAEAIISEEERRAALAIGVVGLGLAGFLAVLYAFAKKTGMGPFQPVPWVLTAFALVAGLRVVLARARIAPKPILVHGLIALDFALLYGLIVSFHVQYEQPASFALKSPALVYAFVLIAMRALRFDVTAVLVAGACAALGWVAVTAYAVWASPATAITHDYRTYMTSNAILVGAEVEKVFALIAFTLVLARVVFRARRQLVAAAIGATASEDLARVVSPEIARRLAASDHAPTPGENELRRAAVLVADLRGFTRYASRLRADEVGRFAAELQQRMGDVIEAHGGAVDKFLGDGVMATFGCVSDRPAHAADALRAALALTAETDAWSVARVGAGATPLRVDCAVTAGEVVFGVVGHAQRVEFTVLGDPVNLAAKLEAYNKTLDTRVLTDAATLALARAQGFGADAGLRPYPGRDVPGTPRPLDLHGVPAEGSRRDVPPSP